MDAIKLPTGAAGATTPEPATAAAKSARDFEAVFIGQMTKMMMETAQVQGDFTGGHGEEMFRGVLAEQLGGTIAARGGLGIAPVVMKQLIALQGGTPQAAPVVSTQRSGAATGTTDAR